MRDLASQSFLRDMQAREHEFMPYPERPVVTQFVRQSNRLSIADRPAESLPGGPNLRPALTAQKQELAATPHRRLLRILVTLAWGVGVLVAVILVALLAGAVGQVK